MRLRAKGEPIRAVARMGEDVRRLRLRAKGEPIRAVARMGEDVRRLRLSPNTWRARLSGVGKDERARLSGVGKDAGPRGAA